MKGKTGRGLRKWQESSYHSDYLMLVEEDWEDGRLDRKSFKLRCNSKKCSAKSVGVFKPKSPLLAKGLITQVICIGTTVVLDY